MTQDLFSLEGRRALVTGAAKGIGAQLAAGLAAAGADMVLWGRSAQSLSATAEQCRTFGRDVTTVVCDLADHVQVKQRAHEIASEVEVDILINNAGTISRGPAVDVDFDDWRHVLALNLDIPFLLCQQFGRAMVDRGSGSIVNVASLLSFQGGVLVPAYTASKHALAGLTKALANEWAPAGVSVNAVAPGYIETDNTAALRADHARGRLIQERIPAGRWGTPSDVVGAVVFLAGPAARYVNGHVLVVDGGWMGR
jgi:2-deoxy-D-gluconate 3-dehydrogenase